MSGINAALPPHWQWQSLKYLTALVTRGIAPSYVDDSSIRVISQAANQASGLEWDRCRFHDHRGTAQRLKGYLKPGDVLVNSTGTGTLGRIGYFRGGPDKRSCVADGHITVVRGLSSEVDSRFLYYWMASRPFQDYVYAALIVGATNQIELNRDRLVAAPVPLPPLGEQRRIADFLDAETARIDELSAAHVQQIALLEDRYSAELSALVTPGILATTERSHLWPWLPASLQTCRLGYLARVQSGVTVDSGREGSPTDRDYPYLRVANVQGESVDLSEIKVIRIPTHVARRSTLQRGDVVMTEANGNPDNLGRGSVWDGSVVDMVHQNHIFAIRTNRDTLLPEYLSSLLASVHGRRYFRFTSSQVGIATTSSSKVLDFPVPLMPLAQQREISVRSSQLRGAIGDALELLQMQLSLLAERRQALITAAVTGQLDVSTAGQRSVIA